MADWEGKYPINGRLAGKNAIITGAAGGIGLETTILFMREGASVLMTDVSEASLAKAKEKVHELAPNAKGKLDTAHCDVTKEADIERVVNSLDDWGGVDVMFNNAGIMHPADADADAIDTPEKIWDLTQAVNVKGVWYGSKHAIISLRRHKKSRGSIINTASMVALVGASTPQLAYTASKGAVLAMTRELAIVHAKESYRFNSLCPAPLNTPLLQDWLGDDAAKRHRREIHFPTGRFGEAIEQAQAVLFLASDESSFVNGTDFVVDGGLTKAYVTPQGPRAPAPANLARYNEGGPKIDEAGHAYCNTDLHIAMAMKRKHLRNAAMPIAKRRIGATSTSRTVQLKAERDRAFRLERANDVRAGKWQDLQSDPVSIVATVLTKFEQGQERRAKRKAKKQSQTQRFHLANSTVLEDEAVDSIEPDKEEEVEKPVAGAAYIALLKSLPTVKISEDTMKFLAKIGSRGSPYVGRTVSIAAGHKPGNIKANKRRTNGHTAQDVLLPSAASRSNRVPKHIDGMTVADMIYILVNHLVWKDLEIDEFLSYSNDFMFLFIHALNRHSERQGNVTIQIVDRRACEDMNEKPVPFWSALDLANHFDIYNDDYIWDPYMQGDIHPRKFTHEYLTWGSLHHTNSTLLQADLADLIADGLYKLFPDFETPRGCGRVGLYQGQVRCRAPGYPPKEGVRNATSLYSYTDCDKEEPMTVELLMLVRKLALHFGTKSKVGGYRLAGVDQPHLYVFLNLLTFHKRPAREPVFLSWIMTHYSVYDIEEL
ncbi:hypothetical protein B0A48_11767 [Cryoendolithus antarcticus]|uniref:Uncharacterized protein n=1 Tax=Cryoendolithus antarcticus TaxID=1507870 RepID=A0A1V8SST0_9PEZI|nr:hypothetical protein B0A48_11767 [Cryoendolithus antarcticus]